MSSPFDEQRYKGLLEGLEVSEVMLSELERTKRIDSEFYKKENLQIISFIKERGCNRLVDLVSISDGNHMSISNKFSEIGIPYYRGQDIHSFFIENAHPVYIDEKTFDQPVLKRSHLQKSDLLLSIVGTIGKVSLVYSKNKSTCSCKLAILRSKGVLSSELLAIFLSSKYGQNQIQKFVRGAVQMGLILEDMDQLFVPIFPSDFDKKIKDKITLAYNKSEQSQQFYNQAEELLLETIGLKDFQPTSENKIIKSFSESFLATGRLDAEYYQPKYEDYLQLIQNYSNGFELLQDVCNLKDSNFTPEDNVEYKYIELSDIGKSGDITGCTIAQGAELPTRARRTVKTNDVIISSIEGSLSSCALITIDYNNALCSTGFYVINSKKINSETLLVLFKSELMQNILKQNCSGTILTAINKTEFQNIPVPLIENEVQQQITELLEKSFYLCCESKRLLNEAKDMVEKEIESVIV